MTTKKTLRCSGWQFADISMNESVSVSCVHSGFQTTENRSLTHSSCRSWCVNLHHGKVPIHSVPDWHFWQTSPFFVVYSETNSVSSRHFLGILCHTIKAFLQDNYFFKQKQIDWPRRVWYRSDIYLRVLSAAFPSTAEAWFPPLKATSEVRILL